jgi:hypothetical protein
MRTNRIIQDQEDKQDYTGPGGQTGLYRSRRTNRIIQDQEDKQDYTGPGGQTGLYRTRRTNRIIQDQEDKQDYTGPGGKARLHRIKYRIQQNHDEIQYQTRLAGQTGLDSITRTNMIDRIKRTDLNLGR